MSVALVLIIVLLIGWAGTVAFFRISRRCAENEKRMDELKLEKLDILKCVREIEEDLDEVGGQ